MFEIVQTDAIITNEEENKRKQQKIDELREQRDRKALQMYVELEKEADQQKILDLENAKNNKKEWHRF